MAHTLRHPDGSVREDTQFCVLLNTLGRHIYVLPEVKYECGYGKVKTFAEWELIVNVMTPREFRLIKRTALKVIRKYMY
jgi:hypothetical protein